MEESDGPENKSGDNSKDPSRSSEKDAPQRIADEVEGATREDVEAVFGDPPSVIGPTDHSHLSITDPVTDDDCPIEFVTDAEQTVWLTDADAAIECVEDERVRHRRSYFV